MMTYRSLIHGRNRVAHLVPELRRLTGTVVSRRGLYAKAPPEAISEFLNSR